MRLVLFANSTDIILVTGCDVDDSLGSSDGFEDSDFFGELTYGFRGWKGEQYFNFL